MSDFAPMLANQNGEGRAALITKQGYALYAEKNFQLPDSGALFVAQGVAVQSIDGLGEEVRRVYDLQVEGEHEYFANGILVHNCLDALRYGLFTRFGQNAGYGQYSVHIGDRRR
jgi:hypothetical protein